MQQLEYFEDTVDNTLLFIFSACTLSANNLCVRARIDKPLLQTVSGFLLTI